MRGVKLVEKIRKRYGILLKYPIEKSYTRCRKISGKFAVKIGAQNQRGKSDRRRVRIFNEVATLAAGNKRILRSR